MLRVIEIPDLLVNLKASEQNLEMILKGLNNYLELKRLYFPRFFFLSNDEMLEILSQTKDPTRVVPHLKKCFEGVADLEFDSDLVIKSLYSSEQEKLALVSPISTELAKGAVEKWLSDVEAKMLLSVQNAINESIKAYSDEHRTEWLLQWVNLLSVHF